MAQQLAQKRGGVRGRSEAHEMERTERHGGWRRDGRDERDETDAMVPSAPCALAGASLVARRWSLVRQRRDAGLPAHRTCSF